MMNDEDARMVAATRRAASSNLMFEDDDTRDETNNSTINEISFEIQQMTRDADMILDSIRNETMNSDSKKGDHPRVMAASVGSSSYSIDSPGGHTSATEENTINVTDAYASLSMPAVHDEGIVSDDEDDDLQSELQKLESLSAVVRKSLEIKNVNLIEESPLNAKSAFHGGDDVTDATDDDGMLSELRNLASLTSAVRQSLNNQETQILSSPLIFRDLSRNEDNNVFLLPPKLPQLLKPKQSEEKHCNSVDDSAAKRDGVDLQFPQLIFDKFKTLVNEVDAIFFHASTELASNEKSQHYFAKIESWLKIVVLIVWTIVILLIFHAKYYLLDANGMVKLPFL